MGRIRDKDSSNIEDLQLGGSVVAVVAVDSAAAIDSVAAMASVTDAWNSNQTAATKEAIGTIVATVAIATIAAISSYSSKKS